MPKVSTTVVATAKSVAEKAKKWVKMAILWLYYSHKGCLMAPRLLQHEYLLAPMIWCDFYHFRIFGSIICRQLLHSFTDVMKGASPFKMKFLSFLPQPLRCTQPLWLQWRLQICHQEEQEITSIIISSIAIYLESTRTFLICETRQTFSFSGVCAASIWFLEGKR